MNGNSTLELDLIFDVMVSVVALHFDRTTITKLDCLIHRPIKIGSVFGFWIVCSFRGGQKRP
jgi:hypothetical protein